MKYQPSSDFATMLHALAEPGAFPFTLPDDEPIPVIQTHASAVLLTPERAYKLKKPKNFGFFDYSTPTLRRHFCGLEVQLNTRLAPQVYLGIAPVVAFADGRFRFGSTFPPDDVPMPGTPYKGGYTVDYAVVMVRLPDEATLEYRVRSGTASSPMLATIAQYVGAFHVASRTNEHIASFGSLDVIRGNWEENFEQMSPYIGRTLDEATYTHIAGYVRSFMEERAALFANRVHEERIRDCHGDLRLQHIYILDTLDKSVHQGPLSAKLAILDGIEFNERFRFSDVSSEIAFLTMELDAAGRSDLSRAFVDEYVAVSRDEALRELLPFYACYRACVRGKVLSFQLDEPEVSEAQHEDARQEARALFALAANYATGPIRPALVLIGGLMGTGKSTLSLALNHELGWALLSSDAARKRLARLDPKHPQADAFGQGLYSAEWTANTYHALLDEARATLAKGRSVLIDASFIHREDRQAATDLAAAYRATIVFVECACPREVALERLAQRWQSRLEGRESSSSRDASSASDGRPELYDAQCAVWEEYFSDREPDIEHIVITTTLPIAVNVVQIFDTLHMSQLVGAR